MPDLPGWSVTPASRGGVTIKHPVQAPSSAPHAVVERTTPLTVFEARTLAHKAATLPEGSALIIGSVGYRLTRAEADALASEIHIATGVLSPAHTITPTSCVYICGSFLWASGDDGWQLQPKCTLCEVVTGPAFFTPKGSGRGHGVVRLDREAARAAKAAKASHTCIGDDPMRADGTWTGTTRRDGVHSPIGAVEFDDALFSRGECQPVHAGLLPGWWIAPGPRRGVNLWFPHTPPPPWDSLETGTIQLTLVETRELAHAAATLLEGSAVRVGRVSYRLTSVEAAALARTLSAATRTEVGQAHTVDRHRIGSSGSLFLWSDGSDGWCIQPLCIVCEEVTGPVLFVAKGAGGGHGKTRMFAEERKAAKAAKEGHTTCVRTSPLRADGTSVHLPTRRQVVGTGALVPPW